MPRSPASRPALDWDDVRVFLEVTRARSLARGAREAGLDRSTASRRIAALEEALGAELFVRTRDGLRLTAAGERLVPHAEQMALGARALGARAEETTSRIAGVVRIATTEAMAAMLVEEGLLRLREPHPGLVLELLGANRPVDLTRGEAELALRLSPLAEAQVKVRRIARFGLSLVASEGYLRKHGSPASLERLEGHDVVVPGGELSRLPEAKWLAAQPGVRVVFRSSSMAAVTAAIAEGVGLGVMTDGWATRKPGLKRLFPMKQLEPRPLFLATAPGLSRSASVRVVAEGLVALFERLEQQVRAPAS